MCVYFYIVLSNDNFLDLNCFNSNNKSSSIEESQSNSFERNFDTVDLAINSYMIK